MKILNNINVGIVMNMDIAQKDAIINQQKFLIDDMTKDIKRLTKEISELKFESLYYEP